MKVYIKHRKRRSDEFQFFMHNFVDVCIELGFKAKPDVFASYKWHLRSVCRRVFTGIYKVQKALGLLPARRKALIVTANGGTINENVFPYFWGYEIIPMLWDCWPTMWQSMFESLRFFQCKLVFVSSRQVADKIRETLGIDAVWISEGIEPSIYQQGSPLRERPKNILELGRRHHKFHEILLKSNAQLTASPVLPTGRIDASNLLYKNDEEMAADMCLHKIFVCFPNCDTQPERAKGIETLTQRYWEGMLSRCVIIGRAPQELVDLIGYNPVVDVDWNAAEQQINNIIQNIEEYQDLVDKNYETAQSYCRWENRIIHIKDILTVKGYKI